MSTLHKVKAYFGMAPMEDYDDEYYDDHGTAGSGYPRQRFADDGYGRYGGRDYDDPRGEAAEYGAGSYESDATAQALDLLGDLGLGQLDLVVNQLADALRYLGDRRRDAVLLSVTDGQGA